MARRAFLALFSLSGSAALLYQVVWMRLLTLHMGHTAAAAGTVLAAFMGGLAIGAALAGRVSSTLPRDRALVWYARLELAIAAGALIVPFGLAALNPMLQIAYADGTGSWFGVARALSSLLLIAVPAAAMGATFPLAVRWFAGAAARGGKETGVLYAANTVGAAVGAAATGFILLPAFGLRIATAVGILINVGVAVAALRLAPLAAASPASPPRGRMPQRQRISSVTAAQRWVAAAALGVSGFVALLYEVVWTRALALVLGPTTYAFTAMVVVFIIGIACGSWAASRLADRTSRPVLWLAASLAAAALGALVASTAIAHIPLSIAESIAASDATFTSVITRQATLIAPLLLPMTVAFGAAFPFAVAVVSCGSDRLAGDAARVYVMNTAGAIGGALAGSFLLIPWLGLQHSIVLGAAMLAGAAVIVAVTAISRALPRAVITAGGVAIAAAGLFLPPWNVHLLSSGAYLYGVETAGGDPQASLEAGELLYYAEGAAGVVSVRRVAGTTSLAIDGKVDASNGADMLTQKLLAHLPLLLHPSARDVAVIGYGSGVTVGAALQHPVTRVDVLEISPEVIEASALFRAENHDALADDRTQLVIADGRTHLMLSNRAYDVIISEPSNPWMAGVAALFTREFFAAARSRLAPGGVFCQWSHTYDIADEDLRSIVATFASVFPDGSMWLVGEGDLLLIGSTGPVVDLLGNITRAWDRGAVARDLGTVGVRHPFALFSMFLAAGPALRSYGRGEIQTDARLALEFSAPRGMYAREAPNAAALREVAGASARPVAVSEAIDSATGSMWRDLGLMHLEAKAADAAYAALERAAASDARDEAVLDGLVRAAVASGREQPAVRLLEDFAARDPQNAPARVALSRLLASTGQSDAAVAAAGQALQIDPRTPEAREQLASVFADAGDAPRLEGVVRAMTLDTPERPGTLYYQAVLHFLKGEFNDAAAVGARAASADPANARVQNLLGAAFVNLGQSDRARAAFEASARQNPRDPAALTNLGVFELESSNPVAAASHFAEALLLDPRFAAASRGLADALERQGETARAERVRGR